jgi:nucleotide-binding universal stress UspA family protein
MKILLALDPPEQSAAAVREVAARPWPPNTVIEVLSVVEPSYVWDVATLVEGLKEAAEDAAQSAADQLRSAGLKAATARVLCGDAKTVIVDHAGEIEADFVFVGSRGTTGLTRFLLGSVAAGVARFAPCSVEIVRDAPAGKAPRTAMKVLLATDGSEFSRLAARSIADRPWPAGAEFRILSVAELAVLLKMPFLNPSTLVNLRSDAIQRAEDAKAAVEQILTNAGLVASGVVASSTATPKETILHTADEWGSDLIVCGSHGRRGVSHFLLGSVSEAIASHAKCSVEIIRPRPV